jgi:hypothetical protein
MAKKTSRTKRRTKRRKKIGNPNLYKGMKQPIWLRKGRTTRKKRKRIAKKRITFKKGTQPTWLREYQLRTFGPKLTASQRALKKKILTETTLPQTKLLKPLPPIPIKPSSQLGTVPAAQLAAVTPTTSLIAAARPTVPTFYTRTLYPDLIPISPEQTKQLGLPSGLTRKDEAGTQPIIAYAGDPKSTNVVVMDAAGRTFTKTASGDWSNIKSQSQLDSVIQTVRQQTIRRPDMASAVQTLNPITPIAPPGWSSFRDMPTYLKEQYGVLGGSMFSPQGGGGTHPIEYYRGLNPENVEFLDSIGRVFKWNIAEQKPRFKGMLQEIG